MLVALLLIAGLRSTVNGQKTFRVTAAIERAYDQILSFHLTDALHTIERIASEDSSNLMRYYLADLREFFIVFATEDEKRFAQYQEASEARLEAIKRGDETSPYYLYTQAEVHLHMSVLRFRFGENFGAATALNRGFKLLKRNERRFPGFAPNLKDLGMLRAGVGTIPDKYKWAVKLISSLEGTIPEGMADLRRGIALGRESHHFMLREMHFHYALSLLHFDNKPQEAWEYVNALDLDPEDNVVDCFLLANIALKTGHTTEVIGLITNLRKDPGRFPIPYLNYMLGVAKLYRNDADAGLYILKFVQDFSGRNYIKEAYQKLAWHSLIHGDRDGYIRYMEQCLEHGAANTDEDKYALEEARRKEVPHPGLLRARLLFDGGYHTGALGALDSILLQNLNEVQKLEYNYRLGRVYHVTGHPGKALTQYRTAIATGADQPYYYACNAALQAGQLCEEMGRIEQAGHFYTQCLQLHPEDYEASLHQKAKAGLNRIRSKR